MVKTNAERQAEYRLRQQGLGDKKRLNIWLSSRAHQELSKLAKRKGMTQQVLIEWLLTNDQLWNEEGAFVQASAVVASGENVKALLRNESRTEGGGKTTIKKGGARLLRNIVPEIGIRKSGEQPDRPAEQAPPLPLPSQFELKL